MTSLQAASTSICKLASLCGQYQERSALPYLPIRISPVRTKRYPLSRRSMRTALPCWTSQMLAVLTSDVDGSGQQLLCSYDLTLVASHKLHSCVLAADDVVVVAHVVFKGQCG